MKSLLHLKEFYEALRHVEFLNVFFFKYNSWIMDNNITGSDFLERLAHQTPIYFRCIDKIASFHSTFLVFRSVCRFSIYRQMTRGNRCWGGKLYNCVRCFQIKVLSRAIKNFAANRTFQELCARRMK